MIGKTISHYVITEKLGEGGMGVVYKARDTRLDRFVAVKVLPQDKVANPQRKERFIQEARSASALNHPNIIVVHDIVSEEGTDFMVMEYVEGKTLDQLIPRKGMRLNEALRIGIQMAGALARAHDAGVVHRDLKPSNAMVDKHDHVKVLDFGLAKLTEKNAEDVSTATVAVKTDEGSIVGTAAYMSPEQAEGKSAGPRSDIFSMGAVLYEMLSGQRAFRGDSQMSTLSAVLQKNPDPLPADIPPEVGRIVARCLRKDPMRRFQHMDDVQVALQELLEESDSGRLSASAVLSRKHRGWKWAFVAGVAVLLLAAAGWIAREIWFQPAAPLETSLLTSLPGNTGDPAFSPDGRQVAFSWNGEKQDRQSIYLKLIGSPNSKQISMGAGSDNSPAFSPDGLSIAFCRWTPGKVAVVLIPAIGGPERILAEIPVPPIARMAAPPYISWAPEGQHLISVTLDGLVALSLETGEMRTVVNQDLSMGYVVSPAVSPDGKRLAFVRTNSGASGTLFVLDLTDELKAKSSPKALTPKSVAARQPAWTPDSKSLVFSTGSLWIVDASGMSAPRRLAIQETGISSPTMPRQANRLIYRRSISMKNIWRVQLAGPESERAPQRLIASTRIDSDPDYSPDGTRIVFPSSRTGRTGIWICDNDGTNAIELFTPPQGRAGYPRWSPDGKRIVFDLQVGERFEIHTISARGGKPVRVETGMSASGPTWSRDGSWIYFGSPGSGRFEVWKVPEAGGKPQQVTRNGGVGAMESVDGKLLYYSKVAGVWKAPINGGEEVQVLKSAFSRAFRVTAAGVYFASQTAEGGNAIQFLDFATGKTRRLAKIAQPFSNNISISPDGRFALYPQDEITRSELVLVEKFRE